MIYHSTNRRRTIGHRIAGGQHRITRRFGVIVVVLLLVPTGVAAAAAGFAARLLAL